MERRFLVVWGGAIIVSPRSPIEGLFRMDRRRRGRPCPASRWRAGSPPTPRNKRDSCFVFPTSGMAGWWSPALADAQQVQRRLGMERLRAPKRLRLRLGEQGCAQPLPGLAGIGDAAGDRPIGVSVESGVSIWVHFYDNDPPKPFTWGHNTCWSRRSSRRRTAQGDRASIFRGELTVSVRRTAGIRCGGRWNRRRICLTAALTGKARTSNPSGPNILIDLPPAIKNFPAYAASNYDPTSPAAQNILAAGYPRYREPCVTPRIQYGAGITAQFWEVTACQWQERFDPTYPTYTAGLGDYSYLARLGLPGVFHSVSAVHDHREDQEAIDHCRGNDGRPTSD